MPWKRQNICKDLKSLDVSYLKLIYKIIAMLKLSVIDLELEVTMSAFSSRVLGLPVNSQEAGWV